MNSNEYVTVVAVENGNNRNWPFAKDQISNPIPITDDSQFITVVAVNDCVPLNTRKAVHKLEIVTVYRLPGERIGFGLKFQGGAKNHENIERLFIQSCSPGSPASRALASWGHLKEGDEILEINDVSVTKLTRLECVKRLKESIVAINFLIRNGDDILNTTRVLEKSPPPPPPVPPRKINRKKSFNEQLNTTHIKVSATTEREFILPPNPESYTNLFENELLEQNMHETESDDTGSTISTVIDHFSISSDTEASPPDTNLDQVLKTFTQLEEMHKKTYTDIQPAERKKRPTVTPPSPPSPPTPLPRQIIKIEPKIIQTLEPIKIDTQTQLSSQFTTIHNWLQDTSDVVHDCIIMVDENGNEFNTVTQDKITDSNDVNVDEHDAFNVMDNITSDTVHSIGPSEAYFNLHWGPSVLPTIGEVEEEFSSMEHLQNG